MVKVRRNKPKPKQEKAKKARLSQFLHKKAEGRQNRYVFKGFYDKLNAITAKLGHTSTKRYGYSREDEATRYLMGFGSYEHEDEERVQLSSNFISMIYDAPKLNASMEFKKLHSELQQYISSFNLVLLKKDEIIEKLMGAVDIQDGKAKDPKLVISVIDLLIALIKDLRNEISFETLFIDQIFPKIITVIDVVELELLEQISKYFNHFEALLFQCFRVANLPNYSEILQLLLQVHDANDPQELRQILQNLLRSVEAQEQIREEIRSRKFLIRIA